MSTADSDLLPIAGIRLGVAAAGIKKPGRDDMLLIEMAGGTQTAAVFTRNAFCAAPVQLARKHLATQSPRYLLINSGNANAGTGQDGLTDAALTCQFVARETNCQVEEVLPFSTGVIGMRLPMEKMASGVSSALASLAENNWVAASRAIMTTDTVPKTVSRRITLSGKTVVITGIAKGSGMIRPDMATMLAYLASDVGMPQSLLQKCLFSAVETSFNRITVDGDTSTNDACVLMATGKSGVMIESEEHPDYLKFVDTLSQLCEELARSMVRDGEGATKLITIQVDGGKNADECKQVAYTIAHSPLVKTAFFASDPNWGRILAAVGRAGLAELNIDAITIHLNDVLIVEKGGVAASYTEAHGQQVMNQTEITIHINLGRGSVSETIWTCDFSYDYVKINAEYRS